MKLIPDSAGNVCELLLDAEKLKINGLLFTDIDGVLTNGQISLLEKGTPKTYNMMNSYSVIDGAGMSFLRGIGIYTIFVTQKSNYVNYNHRNRAHMLGCPIYEVDDKKEFVEKFIEFIKQKTTNSSFNVFAIGDDAYDLPMLKLSDFCGCPYQSNYDVLEYVYEREAQGTGTVLLEGFKPGINAFRRFADLVQLVCRNQ